MKNTPLVNINIFILIVSVICLCYLSYINTHDINKLKEDFNSLQHKVKQPEVFKQIRTFEITT